MRSSKPSLTIIALLALIGVIVSVMSLDEYSMNYVANQVGVELTSSFCNINAEFNCTAVNQSAWALWFGIPVAAFGLWFYLVLILATALFSDSERFYDDEVTGSFAFVSLIGVVVSIVMFWISKFEIGVYCPTCLVLYAINFLIFLVVVVGGIKRKNYLASVRDGIFGILGFIIEAITSSGRNRSSTIRLFVLAVIISALFSYTLRDYLSLRYLAKFTAESNWEEEDIKKIKLNLGEGIKRDFSKGPHDAPVKIVKFADYECPACQVVHLVISELLQRFPDKILFVYKDYPLDNSCNPALKEKMHENACYAATLARCAGEQDKFWQMNDYLFGIGLEGEQLDSETTRAKMTAGIAHLELDKEKVEICLESEIVKQNIQSDIRQGDKLGLVGTPTIFINGKMVRDTSYDSLLKIVTQILGS